MTGLIESAHQAGARCVLITGGRVVKQEHAHSRDIREALVCSCAAIRSPSRSGVELGSTPMGGVMPERETLERARRDKREGKSPSTQAGEFVREEIEHIREG